MAEVIYKSVSAVEDSDEEQNVIVGSSIVKYETTEHPDPFLKIDGAAGLNDRYRKRLSRTLSKKHEGANGAGSKKEELNEVSGYNLFDLAQPPYNLDYLAQLTTASEAHAAAIAAKTTNIVLLGYDFVESYKTKALLDKVEDEKKLQKLRRKLADGKNALFDRLDETNTEDDFLETLRKVWTDYEATGNGYFEIGRGALGEVAYIGHIPATTMRVRKARDGFVQVISNKAVFFRNFGEDNPNPITADTQPNEIIHIKKYTPTNGYYGAPDIISALTSVAGNKFAQQFNLDYFENKAVPRYVIVIKGGKLSSGSDKKIVDFFEANLKGKGGNHRTLFIPLPADDGDRKASFEMKPVEAGTQDASFVNYHKINLNNILMAHRVPITKVSVAETASLSTARDADKTFKEQVCRPEQRILEKKLNKVFKTFTDAFTFKLNELTLTDEDTQSQIDERDVRNNIVVPNEVRARRGMPALPNGDKSAAQLALDTAKATKTDPGAQARADAKATAGQTRTRDAQRSAVSPDKSGESRNPKGDGRQVA